MTVNDTHAFDPERGTMREAPDREDRLDAVIAAYLNAVEFGGSDDPQPWLERHPDLAEDLAEFFADRQLLERVAQPMREAVCDGPALGSRIQYVGDYELLEELGRGGMGVVYRAQQLSLKRQVALKMILSGAHASPEDVARFRAEAEAVASLQHPHIVQIHEIGEHEGRPYASLEFVSGGSLDRRLTGAPLPAAQAAALLWLLSRAVHAAHERGVVHRDLKPANILLSPSDQASAVLLGGERVEPKITDFGLAKLMNGDLGPTHTGAVLGTPSYMAPEQAAGKTKEIGPAADVYALGAILYELLTGRPPFRGETPLDTITQVLKNEPAPPRLLNPGTPRDLQTIALKCLEKEPKKRYATAAELADDLARFLREEPILARPVGAGERTRRWLWKRRRNVAALSAVAAMAVAAVLGAWWGWNAYDQWRSGEILLDTAGAARFAEIRNREGELVLPRFSVPTAEPVSLPAGEHQLQLSAPGQWTEEYRMLVWQGERRDYTVGEEQEAWRPMEIRRGEHFEVVRLEDRDDLLVFTPLGVRRVHGATTQTIWETNLDEVSQPVLKKIRYLQWKSLLEIGTNEVERPPLVLRPPPDLNGDGVSEVVITASHPGVALALSGASGELLWAWNPDFPNPQGENNVHQPRRRIPTSPAISEVDGDDTPDLIFTYATEGEHWVEALSGAGQTLWKRLVNEHPASQSITYDEVVEEGGTKQRRSGSYHTAVLVSAARPVQLSEDTALVGMWRNDKGCEAVAIDPAAGEVLWRHALPVTPVRAPRYLDLNGDGIEEALLAGNGRLSAWNLEQNKPLWSVSLPGNWHSGLGYGVVADLDDEGAESVIGNLEHSDRIPARRKAVATDLDGDGRIEIVLPGPHVVDATGRTLWQIDGEPEFSPHEFTSGVVFEERFTIGPDVNADGAREVYTAVLEGNRNGREQHRLTVKALSGRDGGELWSAVEEVNDPLYASSDKTPLGPLVWGPPGSDGFPTLLAPCRINPFYSRRFSVTAHVFSSRDGKGAQTLSGIQDPQTADFNGDGLGELHWFVPERQGGWALWGGTLHALLGRPPALWRRAEQLEIVGDLNADGPHDLTMIWKHREGSLVRLAAMTAVSGQNGKLQWSVPGQFGEVFAPAADFNRDGADDILAMEFVEESVSLPWSEQKPHKPQLVALSGASGQRLWSVENLGNWNGPGGFGVKLAVSHDLDHDKRPEVVIGYYPGGDEIALAVLTQEGAVRWREHWKTPQAISADPYLVAAAPLDDEPTDDLLLMRAHEGIRYYRAYRGADGQLLWTREFPARNTLGHAGNPVPQPTSDLNGDGRHEFLVIDDAVLALDGPTGQTLWSWTWPELEKSRSGEGSAGSKNVPLYNVSGAPALADLDGDGKREICLMADEHFVALDAQGQLIQRTRLPGHRPSWEPSDARLWPIDLDGDERDELIYLRAVPPAGFTRYGESPVHVRATAGGAKELLWRWDFAGGWGEIVDVLPARRQHEALVVVRAGTAMYGLSAKTGKPRWRCEDEKWWSENTQNRVDAYGYRRTAPLLLDPRGQPGPLVMFRHIGADGVQTATVCRLALPTDEQGRYLPAQNGP